MANFKIVPASNIEAAKGASLCALYNQPVNGHKGVLIAKAKKKANHNTFWLSKLISLKEIK